MSVGSECVFITAGPSTKLFAWVGGGYGRTCATRDDEPRPVWTSLPISVCFITAGPITKLFAWGEEESGGHVLVVELSLLHKFSLSEDSKTVLLVTIRFCVSLISCPQPRMQGP